MSATMSVTTTFMVGRLFVCVCVCVRKRERECVCVCGVCVFEGRGVCSTVQGKLFFFPLSAKPAGGTREAAEDGSRIETRDGRKGKVTAPAQSGHY